MAPLLLVVLLCAPALACDADKLVQYRLATHTFWARDAFPKHYPDWRPPAQWSKLLGRTHDASYTLYRVGEKVSAGARQFAETGQAPLLDVEAQGAHGILDAFTAPPIPAGVGTAHATFFADGNHSRVSLMARITPSPDWFIGLDSYDLCVNGNWIDSITIEADPLDAGTDNGFTFTAPNWPTEPQGAVYRISSRHPKHPAGSFYYPYLKRLPPIATFQFIKVRELALSEEFSHSQDALRYEVVQVRPLPPQSPGITNNDVQNEIEQERLEAPPPAAPSDRFRYEQAPSDPRMNVSSTVETVLVPKVMVPQVIPLGDKEALSKHFQQWNKDQQLRNYPSKRRKHLKKIRAPRDCRVGDWTEWSACSKSCGIGEMQRVRPILKHPRRGGQPCPPLTETKWCGSARACSREYFNWGNQG